MKSPVLKKQRIRDPLRTRNKLLQATADLVADKGPHALSLKEAAKRANLSRGAAYQHFKDRDHLLREAKRWIAGRLVDGVKELQAAPLEQRALYGARLVLDNPDATRLLLDDALAGKDLRKTHPLFESVLKTIEDLKKEGVARADIDAEVLTCIMLASNAAILMLGQTSKGRSADAIAQRFATEWTNFMRNGMFKHTHTSQRARSKSHSKRKRAST